MKLGSPISKSDYKIKSVESFTKPFPDTRDKSTIEGAILTNLFVNLSIDPINQPGTKKYSKEHELNYGSAKKCFHYKRRVNSLCSKEN